MGRRTGLLTRLTELEVPLLRDRALEMLSRVRRDYGDDLGRIARELMTRTL